MCVAVPGKVVRIGDQTAISLPAEVEFPDGLRHIDLAMIEGVSVGDFVLAHSGYAIRRLSPREAERTAELWREHTESQ